MWGGRHLYFSIVAGVPLIFARLRCLDLLWSLRYYCRVINAILPGIFLQAQNSIHHLSKGYNCGDIEVNCFWEQLLKKQLLTKENNVLLTLQGTTSSLDVFLEGLCAHLKKINRTEGDVKSLSFLSHKAANILNKGNKTLNHEKAVHLSFFRVGIYQFLKISLLLNGCIYNIYI